MSRMLRTRVAFGLVMASFTLLSAGGPGYILPAYSQTQPELKKLNPQFVTEQGCPVEVIAASTEMEMDPFGTPMAARHYIDYRNVSGRPVAAVKFRIGYVADDGKIHQPYLNAPDAHLLEPGGQASQKWRGDRVDPKTREVKIRVLMVKLADGSIWESQKVTPANVQQEQGFMPLTTEGGSADIASADRIPGTAVPLTDVGKNYNAFPEQTTTGPVNFKNVATPPAGFDPNAFGAPGTATTSPAATAGYAPFAGAAPTGAPATSGWGAPAAGAPAGAPGATPAWAAPPSGAPAATPAWAAPAAGAPAATPAWAAPAATPAATPAWTAPAAATPAAPSDPLVEIDKLLGNSPKPAAQPAPAAAPVAAPAAPVAAPASAEPQLRPPAPVAGSPAPATTEPPLAPQAVPATAAPAEAPPAAGAPAAAPAGSAPTGADDFAP